MLRPLLWQPHAGSTELDWMGLDLTLETAARPLAFERAKLAACLGQVQVLVSPSKLKPTLCARQQGRANFGPILSMSQFGQQTDFIFARPNSRVGTFL